jgi:hypothetical protein
VSAAFSVAVAYASQRHVVSTASLAAARASALFSNTGP